MTAVLVDRSSLITIASIIAAFGIAMLYFRIQRELQMGELDEIVWLPWADWLLVAATFVCLLLVLVPVIVLPDTRVAAASALAAVIMVAGYVLAILGHYRIILSRQYLLFGDERTGSRINPEPAEFVIVVLTAFCAMLAFVLYAWKLGLP